MKKCREGQDEEKLKALMDLAAQVGYGFFGCLPKEDILEYFLGAKRWNQSEFEEAFVMEACSSF